MKNNDNSSLLASSSDLEASSDQDFTFNRLRKGNDYTRSLEKGDISRFDYPTSVDNGKAERYLMPSDFASSDNDLMSSDCLLFSEGSSQLTNHGASSAFLESDLTRSNYSVSSEDDLPLNFLSTSNDNGNDNASKDELTMSAYQYPYYYHDYYHHPYHNPYSHSHHHPFMPLTFNPVQQSFINAPLPPTTMVSAIEPLNQMSRQALQSIQPQTMTTIPTNDPFQSHQYYPTFKTPTLLETVQSPKIKQHPSTFQTYKAKKPLPVGHTVQVSSGPLIKAVDGAPIPPLSMPRDELNFIPKQLWQS